MCVNQFIALYRIGQTRVHLDEVEGLGDFLEFEVVLRPEQSEEEGKVIANELLKAFKIDPSQIIGEAYVDLFMSRSSLAAAL